MEVREIVKQLGRCRTTDIFGIGTTKFFVNDGDKQFGFIKSTDGDIFFHGSRGLEFCFGDGDWPDLCALDCTPDGVMTHPPRTGDQIIFIAEQGPRGYRAVKWVKWDEKEYNAILDEISKRPRYRLMRRKGHHIQSPLWGGGDGKGFFVEWDGQNLNELRKQKSKSDFPIFDNNDGARYFQFFNQETKEWENCDDPR